MPIAIAIAFLMGWRRNKDAKAIGYGAAGGRDNEAIDKRITNNSYNK